MVTVSVPRKRTTKATLKGKTSQQQHNALQQQQQVPERNKTQEQQYTIANKLTKILAARKGHQEGNEEPYTCLGWTG